MFDLDTSLHQQLSQYSGHRQTLVFPEPEDPRVIEAASRLVNYANLILVGDVKEVTALMDYGACKLACSRDRFFSRVLVVDPAAEDLIRAELSAELVSLSEGRKWAFDAKEAAAKVLDPVYFGVMLVRCGYADAILGGVTHSTRDFLIPCLRLLEGQGTAFEMGLFALPDEEAGPLFKRNLVMFADVALNLEPTPEQLADIAVHSCQTMRDIIPSEVLPEINAALVSYSTKGSGEGPSVERIRAAEPLINQKLADLKTSNPAYGSVNINTEFQISVAISDKAAKGKLKEQFKLLKGAGKANVLIVPSLDEGNMLYHLYSTRYTTAQSTLIMGGLKHQALDFSRSSTPEQIARGALVLLLGRLRSEHYRATPKDYFFPQHQVLTINPGSSATRVAMYEGERALFEREIRHDGAGFASQEAVWDQLETRGACIDQVLNEEAADLSSISAVVGRAGMLPNMEPGIYKISKDMLVSLVTDNLGEHVANLGAPLALRIAARLGVPAYVADAPSIETEAMRDLGLKVITGQESPKFYAAQAA